jgi:hypothetical protein
MGKFNVYNYFLKQASLLEAEGEEQDPQQMQQQQGQGQQGQAPQPQQAKQPGGDTASAFKSLQGQMITGVSYAPNGASGGVLKIKVKSSYVPFTISWANQTVTIVDLEGNSMVLGTDS